MHNEPKVYAKLRDLNSELLYDEETDTVALRHLDSFTNTQPHTKLWALNSPARAAEMMRSAAAALEAAAERLEDDLLESADHIAGTRRVDEILGDAE